MPYLFSRSITVDHTKVPNTDQSNFPMAFAGTYTWLATVVNGGDVTNANGYDIIFTSDSGGSTVLDFEIESYNAATGEVVFWIRIPTLSHSTDTVIYIFYGNSAITTSQANPTAVWDSNYIGVWHNNVYAAVGSGFATVDDSTGHGHTASSSQSLTTAGKLNGGVTCTGGHAATLDKFTDLFNGSNHIWTIEGWFLSNNPTATNQGMAMATDFPWDNAVIRVIFGNDGGTNNHIQVLHMQASWFNPPYIGVDSPTVISSGVWYHVVMVLDLTGGSQVFVNGASNSGTQFSSGTHTQLLTGLGENLIWGFGPDFHHFDGSLDEIRFSKVARSGDWATTSYNNQNDPSTFYSVSAPSSDLRVVSVSDSATITESVLLSLSYWLISVSDSATITESTNALAVDFGLSCVSKYLLSVVAEDSFVLICRENSIITAYEQGVLPGEWSVTTPSDISVEATVGAYGILRTTSKIVVLATLGNPIDCSGADGATPSSQPLPASGYVNYVF